MGAGSLTIVYPLDYARTRLASDVGSGKKTFNGLGDCLKKTAAGPGGFLALYTGFGVSVVGIVGYRGLQLGTFDTITGINPYKEDKGMMGASPPSLPRRPPSLSVLEQHIHSTPCVVVCRCSPRSQLSSTSTRAPWTASRSLLVTRGWCPDCR